MGICASRKKKQKYDPIYPPSQKEIQYLIGLNTERHSYERFFSENLMISKRLLVIPKEFLGIYFHQNATVGTVTLVINSDKIVRSDYGEIKHYCVEGNRIVIPGSWLLNDFVSVTLKPVNFRYEKINKDKVGLVETKGELFFLWEKYEGDIINIF
jgi:hypothetical protein